MPDCFAKTGALIRFNLPGNASPLSRGVKLKYPTMVEAMKKEPPFFSDSPKKFIKEMG